jgi:hypothetical protein
MSLKRWDGSSWVVVAGSRPGPQGPQGAQGPAGTPATISIGTVNTTAEGTNATVTNTGTASAAILAFNIPRGAVGAQGNQGPQGIAGQRGSKIYTGLNAPTSSNPAPSGLLGNDQYLATSTGAWYIYDASGSGAWSLQGNIKGPQGLKGDTGATGPTGPSGNVVANEIYAKTDALQVDALLNLGIYYPKYTSTLTQSQLNSRFAASSFLF